jgi:hypothetical protein
LKGGRRHGEADGRRAGAELGARKLCAAKDDDTTPSENKAADGAPQPIVITADKDSWTDDVKRLVSITLRTKNKDHGLALFKFQPGVTAEKLINAFKSGRVQSIKQVEKLAIPIGGFVGIYRPETHRLTIRLDPGSYGMLDSGGDPKPNFVRGMYEAFEVSDELGPDTPPLSDGAIVMTEFKIELPEGFTANGTYEVRNDGGLYHELNLGRYPKGVDVEAEIKKAAKTGRSKGQEVTGVWVMAPGTSLYYNLDLPAANYVAACMLPEPPKLGPHALRGMWSKFTVE